MKKNFTKTVLAAILLLCSTAATAYNLEVDGFYYNITDFSTRTLEVTYNDSKTNSRRDDYRGNVTIPASIDYYGVTYYVTSIGEFAFDDCDSLQSVSIPQSITSIGNGAFQYCSTLKEINIPNGVTSIGQRAFKGCRGLESIAIPNGVTTIEAYTFQDCTSLASVTMPSSVTTIGNYAFNNCDALASAPIGSGVTTIGSNAFYGCDGLGSVIIPDGVTTIESYAFSNCPYLRSITIGKGVTTIGSNVVYNSKNLKLVYNNSSLLISEGQANNYGGIAQYAPVVITPQTANQYTVYESENGIGSFLFSTIDGENTLEAYLYDFAEVSIPEDFNGQHYAIGEKAFYNCANVEKFTIPEDVTSIHTNAFVGTAWYKNQSDGLLYKDNWLLGHKGDKAKPTGMFVIPEGTIGIADYAFEKCDDFIGAIFPSTLKVIGKRAFYNCESLMSVTTSGPTLIGHQAFMDCYNLVSITLNGSPTIGNYSFELCRGLTSLTIPGNVKSIGIGAFENCYNLTSLTIGEGVESINNYAFQDGDFASIRIPGSIKFIGEEVFPSNLTSLTIGDGLAVIGNLSFNNCEDLNELIFEGRVDSIAPYAFATGGVPNIYVSDLATWCNINFSGHEGNPLFDNWFYENSLYVNGEKVTNLVIPEGVTTIKPYAFGGTETFTSVTIPASVTNIGTGAFSWCEGLTAVHISDLAAWCNIDFEYFSANPLYCAKNLYFNNELVTDLVIPEGVTTIKANAFYSCTSLKSVKVPTSVTAIENDAFRNCYNIGTVYNESSLNIQPGSSEYGNIALYASEVKSGSAEGDFVFESINGINTLTGYTGSDAVLVLPENYKGGNYVIGAYVFKGNTTITSVVIPAGVTAIGYQAFYECSNLASVTLNEGLDSIAKAAFSYSSLQEVTIPSTLKRIEELTFAGCDSLQSVTFNEGLETIGGWAFEMCTKLQSITFPSTLDSIGYEAFFNCETLTEATFNEGLEYIDQNAFLYCYDLRSAEFPKGLKYIGPLAFAFCYALSSEIVIPESVEYIGTCAFSACGNIDKMRVDEKNKVYDSRNNCNAIIETATNSLVSGCNSTIIPDGIKTIGVEAFWGRYFLPSIVIPNSVEKIDGYAFVDCDQFIHITIPESVTTIEEYAFEHCDRLSDVVIGSNVQKIGEYAFDWCESLKSIYVNSATPPVIGETTFGSESDEIYSNATLYVPAGAEAAYKAADYWKKFANITSDDNEVDTSGVFTYAILSEEEQTAQITGYQGFDELVKICANTIIDGKTYKITSIAEGVFFDHWEILDVIFGKNIESIGKYAFNYCISLRSITFKGDVKSIGECAFQYCNLKEAHLPASLTSLGDYSLTHNYNLQRLTIDANNTTYSIPANSNVLIETASKKVVFGWRGAVIPEGTTTIANGAFNGVWEVTSITIPASVTNIGSWCFDGCQDLEEIYVKGITPAIITPNTFTNYSPTLYVPAGTKEIYETADYWSRFTNIVEMELEGVTGDVNSDGTVDVADITDVIAMILNEDLLSDAGDINYDGTVDVADITDIISIILGTNNAPARAAAVGEYNVELSAEGDEHSLSIDATATDYPYSAVQFDVYLPEGVTATGNITAGSNAAVCKEQADGAVRVVIYSPSNTAIAHKAASIAIDAAGLAQGSHPVEVKNIIFSAPGRAKAIAWDSEGCITIAGTTGIDGVVSEAGDAVVYDLQGRRVTELVKGRVYIKNGRKFMVK